MPPKILAFYINQNKEIQNDEQFLLLTHNGEAFILSSKKSGLIKLYNSNSSINKMT